MGFGLTAAVERIVREIRKAQAYRGTLEDERMATWGEMDWWAELWNTDRAAFERLITVESNKHEQ